MTRRIQHWVRIGGLLLLNVVRSAAVRAATPEEPVPATPPGAVAEAASSTRPLGSEPDAPPLATTRGPEPDASMPAAPPGLEPDEQPPAPSPQAQPEATSSLAVTVLVVAAEAPREPYLAQNTPNPFSGPTQLSFGVPERGRLSIKVYDTAGREVATLADDVFEPGNHTVRWDCRDGNGHRVAAGIYFCRMFSPGFSKTRKLMLLR